MLGKNMADNFSSHSRSKSYFKNPCNPVSSAWVLKHTEKELLNRSAYGQLLSPHVWNLDVTPQLVFRKLTSDAWSNT